MELKSLVKKLEDNAKFKSWKKSNKETYLSFVFKIPQEMKPEEWHLGFYNDKKDKITTFLIKDNDVEVRPEEEVFKQEEMKVKGIELSKIKLEFENVLSKSAEFQQKNFPKDRSIKTIAILQNIEKLGNVWNITYITESFNTLNMKIDASSGKVLHHNLSSILSFKKG